MVRVFAVGENLIYEKAQVSEGTWIKMTAPDVEEVRHIANYLNLEHDDITSSVSDPEEANRLEITDTYALILIDIPVIVAARGNKKSYKTIPLTIILTENNIVTICSEETPILDYFHSVRAGTFSMERKLNFAYQIMFRVAIVYQQVLRVINTKRIEAEEHIRRINDEDAIINLHELESSLVYMATALQGNGNVLNRIVRITSQHQFAEDEELLNDIIIENNQAIEMAQIYRDILDGTRELMSTIINLRLNLAMKHLTSITIVLAIPTVIAGIYGMNVDSQWMPLANAPHGFGIICGIISIIALIAFAFLVRGR